jgi:hypothetical protein
VVVFSLVASGLETAAEAYAVWVSQGYRPPVSSSRRSIRSSSSCSCSSSSSVSFSCYPLVKLVWPVICHP